MHTYLLEQAQAVYVGFESSGNLLGASYYDGKVAVMVRNTAIGGDLVYYGTTTSGGSETRNTVEEIARSNSMLRCS